MRLFRPSWAEDSFVSATHALAVLDQIAPLDGTAPPGPLSNFLKRLFRPKQNDSASINLPAPPDVIDWKRVRNISLQAVEQDPPDEPLPWPASTEPPWSQRSPYTDFFEASRALAAEQLLAGNAAEALALFEPPSERARKVLCEDPVLGLDYAATLLQAGRPDLAESWLEAMDHQEKCRKFWGTVEDKIHGRQGGWTGASGGFYRISTTVMDVSEQSRNDTYPIRFFYMLGLSLYHQGKFEQAEQPLKACASLNHASYLRAHAANLHALGRHHEALNEDSRAVRLSPNEPGAWSDRAYSLGVTLSLRPEFGLCVPVSAASWGAVSTTA